MVLERGIAAIYVIAFVAAARQFRALIGEHGMLPVPRYLRRCSFRQAPSLFQLHYSDRFFAGLCWFGAGVAAALALGAGERVPLWAVMVIWLALWALYLSIVNVGQTWYAFGWESILLECGLLAVFLGNDRVAPPVLVMWLARWLLFRIEFGAGLIKLRGDSCWRDLTCLYYHHETQPMPGPLSWFFHHLPKPLHRIEAAGNHVAQLVVPFGLFAPQPVAGVAAGIIIVTQLWLVASGNFAWLNWITIVLAAGALDQAWLTERIAGLQPAPMPQAPLWFAGLVMVYAATTLVLSYWPVRNMASRSQRMNASFNPLHLVNTYGAFGTVGRFRRELVIEGTTDAALTERTSWREYHFKGKPGAVRRCPRQWAPYHLRLDWLMWFAALSPRYGQPWCEALLQRLLRNDRDTLRLLRHNPFPDAPPHFVRILLYDYRFTTWAELRRDGAWWHRSLVGVYRSPVSATGASAPRERR
ncbi:lipase maturation factor family protein [Mycobacterium sp. UM_Kg1]|uniref:lipase maturation factor family protein n=1 Tax=Mycobacterium sp. UM_Kg1 TaxID=1545691 RepID=UPI00061B280A|nr:lipase maturation factor family protein [Mycobacterium sp. UM_Kg1]